MTVRSFVAMVTISVISVVGANAGDGEVVQAVAAASATAGEIALDSVAELGRVDSSITPWIHPSMPDDMKARLMVGFELAVERVQEVPECGALFAELGADGVEALSNALYFVAGSYKETTTCRGAAAFTYVGDRPTRLCRRFTSMSDDWAALIVVHEALHGAGLTEKPHDPDAMTSGAINKMVRRACGF